MVRRVNATTAAAIPSAISRRNVEGRAPPEGDHQPRDQRPSYGRAEGGAGDDDTVGKGPFRRWNPIGDSPRGHRISRGFTGAEQETDDPERDEYSGRRRDDETRKQSCERRGNGPHQASHREHDARSKPVAEDAGGNLKERIADEEAAEDLPHLNLREAELGHHERRGDGDIRPFEVAHEAEDRQERHDFGRAGVASRQRVPVYHESDTVYYISPGDQDPLNSSSVRPRCCIRHSRRRCGAGSFARAIERAGTGIGRAPDRKSALRIRVHELPRA